VAPVPPPVGVVLRSRGGVAWGVSPAEVPPPSVAYAAPLKAFVRRCFSSP